MVASAQTAPPQPPPAPLVSFVIPSVGRDTLEAALRSLDAQTDRGFEAVLVLDGLADGALGSVADARPWLRVIRIRKTGLANHAGNVRNRGIAEARGEYAAFLDDDDELDPDYVRWLREEDALSSASAAAAAGVDADAEVVVFRMYDPRNARVMQVLPPAGDETFHFCRVGISFAVRARLLRPPDGLAFRPSGGEDFDLLDRLRARGARIVISPRVAYFVRSAAVRLNDFLHMPRRHINYPAAPAPTPAASAPAAPKMPKIL